MQIANTNPHRVITACVHRAAIIPRSAAFIFPVLFILRYRALFIQLFPTSPRTIQRTANSQHYFPLCSLITNRGNYAELKQDLNYVSVMLMCNGLESFIMLESLQQQNMNMFLEVTDVFLYNTYKRVPHHKNKPLYRISIFDVRVVILPLYLLQKNLQSQ